MFALHMRLLKCCTPRAVSTTTAHHHGLAKEHLELFDCRLCKWYHCKADMPVQQCVHAVMTGSKHYHFPCMQTECIPQYHHALVRGTQISGGKPHTHTLSM